MASKPWERSMEDASDRHAGNPPQKPKDPDRQKQADANRDER